MRVHGVRAQRSDAARVSQSVMRPTLNPGLLSGRGSRAFAKVLRPPPVWRRGTVLLAVKERLKQREIWRCVLLGLRGHRQFGGVTCRGGLRPPNSCTPLRQIWRIPPIKKALRGS